LTDLIDLLWLKIKAET